MKKTYIKNKGTTTLISSLPGSNCPGNDNYNRIDWDIDYDGNRANIEMDIKSNGESKHLNYELSNNDLEEILNVPSFQMPLEERLMTDFPIHNESFFIPLQKEIEMPEINEEVISTPKSKIIQLPQSMQYNNNKFESLLQPIRVKKLRSRKLKKKGFSSLRRKLMTPRPKTMRIILNPKSSSSRRRNSSSR
jgi:hypothetical protein